MSMNIFTAKASKILVITGGVFCIIALLLFVWKEPVLNFSSSIDKGSFGLFGDFISGVVGSIWALAGVILFYVALSEQRKDFKTNKIALDKQIEALNLQVEEFRNQRNELELSRKISIEQSKTLKKQQFESTFFSLLQLRNEILATLPKDKENIDYFSWKKHLLIDDFDDVDGVENVHLETIKHYTKYYLASKHEIAHYYKYLYRIIRFVEESGLSDKEKHFYSKIVRSQMTENDLFLLYYYSLTIYGRKLQPLILQYNLLKHLSPMSKMEFNKFSKDGEPDCCATRLFYCDFVEKLFIKFIDQMKINRLKLLEGEKEEVSLPYNITETIIELCADSWTHLKFTIHLNTGKSSILDAVGFNESEFKDFHVHILQDLLCFSRYKNNSLDIVIRSDNDKNHLTFSVSSHDGFEISTDAR